jgi:hypothetical protein
MENAFTILRRQAREKRDAAIARAKAEYRHSIIEIDRMARVMGAPRRRRGRYMPGDGLSYPTMSTIRAAEMVLLEGKPLTLAELTLEVQHRGCRAGDDPRRVANAIRGAFSYQHEKFSRDKAGRWSVVQVPEIS